LEAWRETNLAYHTELDRAMNYIVNDDPTQDVIDAFVVTVDSILTEYNTLLTYISDLDARRLTDIDDVFRILHEGGFDRARDLLISCDFDTFFALEAEAATYNGYFQLQNEEFVRRYLRPSRYTDPMDTETAEAIWPDLWSDSLGE